jgi:hypothetical protein
MESKQTTLQQTSKLKLDFFPPPGQPTIDPTCRSPVQLNTSPESVQYFPRPTADFAQCDCACK